MTPTSRLYGLLTAVGVLVALLKALSTTSDLSVVLPWMLVFDGALLVLMIVDGLLVGQARRPVIQREPLHRLSIGRDNLVTLSLKTPATPAQLQIYDRYPNEFEEIAMPLRATCAAKSDLQLTYTVHPQQRGEFQWGDLEIRQRGPLGLAWRGWRVAQAQKVAGQCRQQFCRSGLIDDIGNHHHQGSTMLLGRYFR